MSCTYLYRILLLAGLGGFAVASQNLLRCGASR
jgi:hypothetical protein